MTVERQDIDRMAEHHIAQIMWWIEQCTDYWTPADREHVRKAVEREVRWAICDALKGGDSNSDRQPTR